MNFLVKILLQYLRRIFDITHKHLIMNITDLLQGPLKDIIVQQVTNKLDLGSGEQAGTAVDGVFATLLNALNRNASTQEGASSLQNALDRDHNGSILDDLTGFLSGNSQPANPNTVNGEGILKHVLGENQSSAADAISKVSGIDTGKVLKLMMMLAPVVLGYLGKAKAQQPQQQTQVQQDAQPAGGLQDLLKGVTQTVNQQPANQSIFSKLLDRDGDGNVLDDIAEMGVKSIFGKILGGK